MFKTLRARLLVSYGLILVIAMAVVGIALLIGIQNRPVPTDEISTRLASTMQLLLEAEELSTVTDTGLTRVQERVLNVLARQARLRNFPVRILLLRLPQMAVEYDSTNGFADGAVVNLEGQPYVPPFWDTNSPPQDMTRGRFFQENGADWRYVAQPFNAQWLYVLALRAPRELTLTEVVQYVGEDVLLPFAQAGLIGLAVAVILTYVITRSVAKPLQEIARAAGEVAMGSSNAQVPVRGPQEARIVAEAFNRMIAEVATTQQAQREFLANVTHDLRTPLTSIQGFSQAISEGVAADPEAAKRAAKIIHDEAARLNRMVEELLDLARIESGRWNMTRHTLQTEDILGVVKERISPRAEAKDIQLEVLTMPLPPIAGDGDRLVQVFTNLADNAIKHTPEGGKVTLRAAYLNAGVQVQVSDTGEGIPPEDLPRIFDRFYQVDKSRQRGPREGAGLGLTIARGIIEAHGGTVKAESEIGRGTTFTVWLPAPTSDATTIIRRKTGTSRRTGDKAG